MIQKLIGNILYVLKKDAYKITRDVTDASIIYVNCNTIDDFRLLNPELNLSPFNYLLLRKTEPIYWPYVDMKDNAEFYFDQGIQNVSSYVDQTYSGVRQEPVYPSDLDVSLLFYFDDVLMDSSAFILTDASSYKIKAEIKDSSKYDDEIQEYLINYEKVKRTGTLSFNTASYEVSTYADENFSGQIQQVSGIPAGQTVNYYLGNSLLSGDSITLTEPGFYVVSARLEDSSIYNDTSTSYTISYQKQKRTANLSFANTVVDVSVEDETSYIGQVQTVQGAPQGVNISYYLGNTLLNNGVISIDNLEEGENTFTITAKLENDPVYNNAQASYNLVITMEISSFENKYLTFESLEDGNTFKFSQNSINYSIDNGQTWIELPANTSTLEIDNGETIMFKGDLTSGYSVGTFSSQKFFNAYGNPMSLLYSDSFKNQNTIVGTFKFSRLFFNNTKIVNASNLSLNSVGASYFYQMFMGCTSLTTAPELPATTLASQCYYQMFNGCSSLTKAPELPATTLAINCYDGMFRGCTSLTTAPELPATTKVKESYDDLFNGCTSLQYIKTNQQDFSNNDGWVSYLPNTGTFILNNSNVNWNTANLKYNVSCIPPYWTVLDANGNLVKMNANISFANSVVNVSTYVDQDYSGTIQSLNNVPSGVTPKYYLDSSLLSSNNITLTTTGNHTVVGAIENDANYKDTSTSYTINYTREKKDAVLRVNFSPASGTQTCSVGDQLSRPTITTNNWPGSVNPMITYSTDGENYGNSIPAYLDTTTAGTHTLYVKQEISNNDFTYKPQSVISTWTYTVEAEEFGGLTVVYNITDTNNEVTLFGGSGGSSDSEAIGSSDSDAESSAIPLTMIVDGVEEDPINTWRFSTTGLHTVQYTFDWQFILNGLFNSNDLITSITFGNDITFIQNFMCRNCSWLTNVTFSNSIMGFAEESFENCLSLTNINLPDNLENINGASFKNCTGLTSITIPDSVTYIDWEAFSGCTGLTSITCLATTPPSLGADVFLNTNNCPIYVPAASVNAYKTEWSEEQSDYASRIYPISE